MKNHLVIYKIKDNVSLEKLAISLDCFDAYSPDIIVISKDLEKYRNYLNTKRNIIERCDNVEDLYLTAITKKYKQSGYNYITYTDSNIYFHDGITLFYEIIQAFNNKDCTISGASIYEGDMKDYFTLMNMNPNIFGSKRYDTGSNKIELMTNKIVNGELVMYNEQGESEMYCTNRNLVYLL
jgi:hypothetical protein